jgi:hypothetical protein
MSLKKPPEDGKMTIRPIELQQTWGLFLSRTSPCCGPAKVGSMGFVFRGRSGFLAVHC